MRKYNAAVTKLQQKNWRDNAVEAKLQQKIAAIISKACYSAEKLGYSKFKKEVLCNLINHNHCFHSKIL